MIICVHAYTHGGSAHRHSIFDSEKLTIVFNCAPDGIRTSVRRSTHWATPSPHACHRICTDTDILPQWPNNPTFTNNGRLTVVLSQKETRLDPSQSTVAGVKTSKTEMSASVINVAGTLVSSNHFTFCQTRSLRGRKHFNCDLQQWHSAKCLLLFFFSFFLSFCLSVCSFVKGNVCRKFAHCFVFRYSRGKLISAESSVDLVKQRKDYVCWTVSLKLHQHHYFVTL